MNKAIDRTGLRYGRLVVLERDVNSKASKVKWKCQCDCGNFKTIPASDLTTGNTKSCGCLLKDDPGSKTHGLSKTTEYHTWLGMKQRCYTKTNPAYRIYGGRGIKVCDRWLECFEYFLFDMGFKPSPEHSIDRIDGDGNYEKSNCRWATAKEQANNLSCNRLVTVDGMTKTVSEMADYFGLKLTQVQNRLARGWSDDETFKRGLTPVNRFITVDGVTRTVTETAKVYNIDRCLITSRLRRGWTPERAVLNN